MMCDPCAGTRMTRSAVSLVSTWLVGEEISYTVTPRPPLKQPSENSSVDILEGKSEDFLLGLLFSMDKYVVLLKTHSQLINHGNITGVFSSRIF